MPTNWDLPTLGADMERRQCSTRIAIYSVWQPRPLKPVRHLDGYIGAEFRPRKPLPIDCGRSSKSRFRIVQSSPLLPFRLVTTFRKMASASERYANRPTVKGGTDPIGAGMELTARKWEGRRCRCPEHRTETGQGSLRSVRGWLSTAVLSRGPGDGHFQHNGMPFARNPVTVPRRS
jgi:hypothetical protein